ncbi:inositol monophosphatase [bacterium]|nr:inositol monophosphatase [bacterium]
MKSHHDLLSTAKDAAEIGGKIILNGFRGLKKSQVRIKGSGDWVTDLDHRSEAAIIRRIRKSFPDHSIQAEESGIGEGHSDVRWFIDPLDGTTNYVHGIPVFSVSIAAAVDGETVAGVVLDPVHDEMFWSVKGGGAFRNRSRIRVSDKKSLSECFFSSGFPWRSKRYLRPYLDSFEEIFDASAGIRRMGSAAIDLAYTACGRYDGFWEMKLKPWDVAAGVLIVREAGGIVSDFRGGQNFMETGNLVAANRAVYPQMLRIVKKHLKGVE